MSRNKKFVVKKDSQTDTITYMEYENRKGFRVKPKNKVNIVDMINVNEMVIINPSLIEKLIDKKADRTLNKFFMMLSVIDEDDDDDTGCMLILDEIARFKDLVMTKYINYMKKEKYKILLQKIEIIEEEVKRRTDYLKYYGDSNEISNSKPRR